MRVVKNVAATGRTVICTIHQPSADLFHMFDDLLLLQRGGYMVYCGPLGFNGTHMIRYMEGLPKTRPCPQGMNPASWMLDVLAGTDSSVVFEEQAALERAKTAVEAAATQTAASDKGETVVIEVAAAAAASSPAHSETEVLASSELVKMFQASQVYAAQMAVLAECSVPVGEPVRFRSKQVRV